MSCVYLLHFEPPYKGAGHYIGYTNRSVKVRVGEHLAGSGSPLVRAAVLAGCDVKVVRVWRSGSKREDRREWGTRAWERRLKALKNTPRVCPVCHKPHA